MSQIGERNHKQEAEPSKSTWTRRRGVGASRCSASSVQMAPSTSAVASKHWKSNALTEVLAGIFAFLYTNAREAADPILRASDGRRRKTSLRSLLRSLNSPGKRTDTHWLNSVFDDHPIWSQGYTPLQNLLKKSGSRDNLQGPLRGRVRRPPAALLPTWPGNVSELAPRVPFGHVRHQDSARRSRNRHNLPDTGRHSSDAKRSRRTQSGTRRRHGRQPGRSGWIG